MPIIIIACHLSVNLLQAGGSQIFLVNCQPTLGQPLGMGTVPGMQQCRKSLCVSCFIFLKIQVKNQVCGLSMQTSKVEFLY